MILAISISLTLLASNVQAIQSPSNLTDILKIRRDFSLIPGNLADTLSILDANFLPNISNDSLIDDNECQPDSDPPDEFGIPEKVFLVIILGVLIATMIVGNILVILAILMERELQRAQYYLVLSLAVADLMVGVVVSPLAALYDINRQWHLGVPMCDFWILSDVLACTSSILHLVAIALDRYWSITDVSYMQKRTAKRIGYMIMVVWAISFCVSVAPMLGWKDSQFHCRVEVRNECLISQDPSYQIFSTTTAFWGPLVLICILYWKIYKAAKRRIQMQVKRRSNTTVAQVRAKILALQLQQQQSQANQPDAPTSAERLDDDTPDTEYQNNGHGPLANGRMPHSKEKLHQKPSNVQIRLIQPSSNEPTATCIESEPLAITGGLNVAKHGVNSFYSLSDIDDDSPPVTYSTTARSGDTEDPSYATLTSAATVKKCNGTGQKCWTDGGMIKTGIDGSVDFSTEDEAEYIDDYQAPSPMIIERTRPPLNPIEPSILPKSPKPSLATLSTPRATLPSVFSQSEFTSTTFTGPATTMASTTAQVAQKKSRFRTKKEAAESSREKRAGRTLAIITGIFVVSWLPFFILAIIRPLCGAACSVPRPVDSVFVWLGYVNSAINPVIYTIFSPDFRNAFKRTLQRFWIIRRS